MAIQTGPAVWLGFVVCITAMLGSEATPVPQVPQGCRDHCAAFTKDGGDYNACVGQCPTVADCLKAMASTDTVEEYIDKVPGLPQRPRPCANHCWRDTVYAMHPCMQDCPATWCRLYSGITLPTSTTSTTSPPTAPPKPTTAKVSKTIDGPIGLTALALGVLIVPIVGIVLYRKRGQNSNISQDPSQHSSAALPGPTIADTDDAEDTPRQGDELLPLGGSQPASPSDAHATPILPSGS